MRRLWNAALTHSPHQPKLASGHKHKRPGERVFFIAPLTAKPRPENAHRYGGIASGATYVESDPIGLDGGSYSTYSYVNNNPISNKDPRGLLVTIQAKNPANQEALQDALNILKSTERGYELWQQLDLSPMIYVISDKYDNMSRAWGRNIYLDPNYHPPVDTTCGKQKSPTEVMLGHEFGHAVRGDIFPTPADELQNIIDNENPIRQELSLPLRTQY